MFLGDFVSSTTSSLNFLPFYKQVPYKVVPYKIDEGFKRRITEELVTRTILLFCFQPYYTFLFYKKFGSAPSTKSFLISHENFAIIVLKVS